MFDHNEGDDTEYFTEKDVFGAPPTDKKKDEQAMETEDVEPPEDFIFDASL